MSMSHEVETRPVTAESVVEAGQGVFSNEAIAELLQETAWSHSERFVRPANVHVFARPVTLLESVRVDLERFQNHRHTLGITQPNGEPLLTYVTLRNVHRDDLLALPKIESSLQGRKSANTEGLSELQLALLDQIWRPNKELTAEFGSPESADPEAMIRIQIGHMIRRYGLSSRTELLVFALQEGLINPRLEDWQSDAWNPMTPSQVEGAKVAHIRRVDEVTEALGGSYNMVAHRIKAATARNEGIHTRGELILAALANGECRLNDFVLSKDRLKPMYAEALALVDQPPEDISEATGVAWETVRQRQRELRKRFGCADKEELVLYAFQNGYLDNRIDPELANVFPPRQQEAVSVLLHGNARTAREMRIAERSVSALLTSAKRNAGVKNRYQLLSYGLRAGLIDPNGSRD